jgi:hypothetical protein
MVTITVKCQKYAYYMAWSHLPSLIQCCLIRKVRLENDVSCVSWVICERSIRKDAEGFGCDLVWEFTPVFTWKVLRKTIRTSISTAVPRVEFFLGTCRLPTTLPRLPVTCLWFPTSPIRVNHRATDETSWSCRGWRNGPQMAVRADIARLWVSVIQLWSRGERWRGAHVDVKHCDRVKLHLYCCS